MQKAMFPKAENSRGPQNDFANFFLIFAKYMKKQYQDLRGINPENSTNCAKNLNFTLHQRSTEDANKNSPKIMTDDDF
uniref:Uncharacterized protein n=1 Tax=Romanomermis culicivorax TaxID=13658 RepID=A0A915J1X2_ROMCU